MAETIIENDLFSLELNKLNNEQLIKLVKSYAVELKIVEKKGDIRDLLKQILEVLK